MFDDERNAAEDDGLGREYETTLRDSAKSRADHASAVFASDDEHSEDAEGDL